MTREQAMKKIRKCLALAGSSNPHEAAAAMRQAQRLMRKYGIDEEAVELSQVEQHGASVAARSAPGWVVMLADVAAEAFSCRIFFKRRNIEQAIFMGVGAQPQVASYAFTILRRQLAADRQKFYRKTRGKRANRIGRSDQFAFAWIAAVSDELLRFADKVPAIVDQAFAMTERELGLVTMKPKQHGNGQIDLTALAAGERAGSKVRLRQGVDGCSPKQIGSAP